MFGIANTGLTLSQFVFIHLFYIFIIALYWRRYVTEFDEYQGRQPLFLILIVLYLLFGFDGGDYYNYAYIVQAGYYSPIEPVYKTISELVGRNYLLFRLIVWGGAYLLFYQTCLRFELDPYKTSYFLFAVFIMIFDYARATLGMAVYFFGVSFICRPIANKKVMSLLLGMCIVFLSAYFHRSMYIVWGVTLMAYLPLNRNRVVMLLVLFVFLTPIINKLFWWLVNHGIMGLDDLNEKIEDYSVQSFNDSFSTFEWIRRTIEYATFFIPFGIISIKIFDFDEEQIDERILSMQKLYKITLGLILLAISTLLVDLETFTLFYRFLYMSMIPICILFCYARENNMVSSTLYKRILYVGIFCKLFGFAKRIGGGSLR